MYKINTKYILISNYIVFRSTCPCMTTFENEYGFVFRIKHTRYTHIHIHRHKKTWGCSWNWQHSLLFFFRSKKTVPSFNAATYSETKFIFLYFDDHLKDIHFVPYLCRSCTIIITFTITFLIVILIQHNLL